MSDFKTRVLKRFEATEFPLHRHCPEEIMVLYLLRVWPSEQSLECSKHSLTFSLSLSLSLSLPFFLKLSLAVLTCAKLGSFLAHDHAISVRLASV